MFTKKIMFAFMFVIASLMLAMTIPAQAGDWKVTESDNAIYATYTVTYADDSLKTEWIKSLDISKVTGAFVNSQTAVFEDVTDTSTVTVTQYDPKLATISLSSAGTLDNWTVTTYLSNYLTNDTTEMNISQVWDTTGQYTAKPVNDTLNTTLSGLPFKYLYVKTKGTTNNREDVVLKISLVFIKD